MAHVYTLDDRTRVFLSLTIHDGLVKRVARETGIPETTVRRWKQQWEREGVPADVAESASVAASTFVDEAELVRDLALAEIKTKIPVAKPGELITIVGVLDDKITRARGLATSRTAVKHELPDSETIKAALMPAVEAMLEAGRKRQAVIVEAEVEPAQRALPPGR